MPWFVWDFERLFPNENPVWATIPVGERNPTIDANATDAVRISKITIHVDHRLEARRHDGERVVWLSIHTPLRSKDQQIGSSAFRNLMQSSQHLGARPFGYGRAKWLLNKGEVVTDGAIRIARKFFEIIDLRMMKDGERITPPVELISLFYVMQLTLVLRKREGASSSNWVPYDQAVREQHGLQAPPELMMLSNPAHIGAT